eukprot:1595551-Pleurochrysis_carterae.AAC.5
MCAGKVGSPVALIVITSLVMITAKDFQARGVDSGAGGLSEAAAVCAAERDDAAATSPQV